MRFGRTWLQRSCSSTPTATRSWLRADPCRFTFHIDYFRDLGKHFWDRGAFRPPVLMSFSRRRALVELKGYLGHLSWNTSPSPFPELTLSLDAQVLVLTHEDATWTEQMPYMAARCAPVQVVECYGRAAKRDPPCKPEECVCNWWKELSGVH